MNDDMKTARRRGGMTAILYVLLIGYTIFIYYLLFVNPSLLLNIPHKDTTDGVLVLSLFIGYLLACTGIAISWGIEKLK